MNLITTTEELEQAYKILKKQKVIAIDSEFIREKTYYPIPCLIQIGYEGGAFLLDPISSELDMARFFELMQNPKILKVFHSARQDIEIIYNLSGELPHPLFDTQIAAQVCGLGEHVSYENLVRVYCGIELDKSCRLTNWQLRPLSEEQLEYAAGDVTHLISCYKQIDTYIKETGREDWIAEDMVDLCDISHYVVDPEEAWQRIRHNGHSLPFLNALKALAAWRERRAMKQNTTRQNVLKDDILINIAAAFPRTMEDIKLVRGVRSDIARSVLAKEIVDILAALTPDKFEKKLVKIDKEKDVSLSAAQHSLYEILKLLLKIASNKYNIVPHLICSEKTLREYIKNPKAENPILKGWRYDVFGKIAEDFRRGKVYLSYNPSLKDVEFKEKA